MNLSNKKEATKTVASFLFSKKLRLHFLGEKPFEDIIVSSSYPLITLSAL